MLVTWSPLSALLYLLLALALPFLLLMVPLLRFDRLVFSFTRKDVLLAGALFLIALVSGYVASDGTMVFGFDLEDDFLLARLCIGGGQCLPLGAPVGDLRLYLPPMFRFLVSALHLLNASPLTYYFFNLVVLYGGGGVALYLTARTIFDARVGFGASLFFLLLAHTYEMGIHSADMQNPVPLLTSFHLLSIYLFHRTGRGSYFSAAVAFALLAAGFHLSAILLLGPTALVGLWRRRLLSAAHLLAMAGYLGLWLMPYAFNLHQLADFQPQGLFWQGLYYSSRDDSMEWIGQTLRSPPWTYLAGLVAGAGLVFTRLCRRRPAGPEDLLALLLVAPLFALVLLVNRFKPLYLLFALPVMTLVAARGLAWISDATARLAARAGVRVASSRLLFALLLVLFLGEATTGFARLVAASRFEPAMPYSSVPCLNVHALAGAVRTLKAPPYCLGTERLMGLNHEGCLQSVGGLFYLATDPALDERCPAPDAERRGTSYLIDAFGAIRDPERGGFRRLLSVRKVFSRSHLYEYEPLIDHGRTRMVFRGEGPDAPLPFLMPLLLTYFDPDLGLIPTSPRRRLFKAYERELQNQAHRQIHVEVPFSGSAPGVHRKLRVWWKSHCPFQLFLDGRAIDVDYAFMQEGYVDLPVPGDAGRHLLTADQDLSCFRPLKGHRPWNEGFLIFNVLELDGDR